MNRYLFYGGRDSVSSAINQRKLEKEGDGVIWENMDVALLEEGTVQGKFAIMC